MSLLPKNEPKEKDITPRMFFIWGQSMSGKTYLARRFPNPIILNTDGNAKKVDTPSVEVFDFETFINVVDELNKTKHTYETVIIDLVDDIKTMLETYVMDKYGIEALADAPYGKAFNDVKMTWKALMVRLSQMKMNVVFISHVIEKQDDADSTRQIEMPSLEQKYYNMTMGRCDLSIRCRKLGSTYHQAVVDRRDTYRLEDISDSRIADILKDIRGAMIEGTDAPKPAIVKKAPVKRAPKLPKADPKQTDIEEAIAQKGEGDIVGGSKAEMLDADTGHDPSVASNAPSAEPEVTPVTPLQAKAKKQLKPLKTL